MDAKRYAALLVGVGIVLLGLCYLGSAFGKAMRQGAALTGAPTAALASTRAVPTPPARASPSNGLRASTPGATATTAPAVAFARPSPWPTPIGELVFDLVSLGKLEVRAYGQTIDQARIEMRRRVSAPLSVIIPAGSYLASGSSGVQNLVVRGLVHVVLLNDDWQTIYPAVACADLHLSVPGSTDSLELLPAPENGELARLMALLADALPPYDVAQAAVWIVTDDASYAELGAVVSGLALGPRSIDEADAVWALVLLDEAGVLLEDKRIWADAPLLLRAELPEHLRTWLAARLRQGIGPAVDGQAKLSL